MTKKCLPITSGHKALGVKLLFERSTLHQVSVSGDMFVAPKYPTFHTAERQTVQKLPSFC
jgi:hypothetical protein